MAEELAETTHFGLTRVGSGESFSKNGYSFSDLDRVKLDRLIWAALTHRHDGGVTLGDPTIEPSMVAHPAGGHLPAATTYYYRVSYVDEHGLETAASPEGIVTTPDPIAAPTSFAGTVESTGGTVAPGIYSYMITFTDAYGGETTPSAINNVQVTGGFTNNIRLDLPDASTNATGYGIYRARPGQSAFYLIGTVTSPTTVFNDSGLIEDQTIQAPVVNSTSAANSIDVTIPGAFIPLGCVSWRIYRATTSGGYDGYSLVHEVTEGVTETSTIPVTLWTDSGDVQLQGFPLETSSCIPPSAIISGTGGVGGTTTTPPQALSAFLPGSPANSQVVTITSTPVALRPVRFTAHFQTPPTDSGVTVTFRLSDGTGNQLDLPCSPTTHASGDPAGYFHIETPTVTGAQYEAEVGALLGSAAVIDDINASSQHAVLLSGTGDGLRVSLGTLDTGTYLVNATLRVNSYDSSTTNDLLIEMVNTTANTVLGSSSITLNTTSQTGYMQIVGPSVAVPGGAVIALRITKATASTQSYAVDSVKISSSHTDLAAGPITIETLVAGGTSSAANANVAVWFYESDTSTSGGSGGGTGGGGSGLVSPSTNFPTLTFQDEFNGTTLDTSKWNINNYRLPYEMSESISDNVFLRGGQLVIAAVRQTSPAGRPWTSGYIDTRGSGKFAQKYGRFEARIKINTTAGNSSGLWPAFWLRPNDTGFTGEIDIMEAWGEPSTGYTTEVYHPGATVTTLIENTNGGARKIGTWVDPASGTRLSDDFHIYAIEWTSSGFDIYLDNVLVRSLDHTDIPWWTNYETAFHVRLQMQVGQLLNSYPDLTPGYWGIPSADTIGYSELLVDWVRVWGP